MTLIAGVDSSTQSTKVELRDLDSGRVVGRASAPHPTTTPPRSEQDPTAWWTAFDQAWTRSGAERVAAIAVGGQQHGMVVLDADDTVIRPAKLWNDTESAADATWLLDRFPGGARGLARATGSVPVASFTITKLSWLHRTEPEAWRRLRRVLLPHDWLTHRMTGSHTTDRGDASGTGYWSPAEETYRWDVLALVDAERDWTDSVPQVLGPMEVAGEWSGALVAPGTGDNMAVALGLGLVPGDAVISLGTSITAFSVSEAATADETGAVAGFADATGRFLPLACTLNGMKVVDAVRRLLASSVEEFDALALASRPGAGGVVVSPYFDGERTPNLPAATGAMVGLRSDVTREQFARATVEGVVCGALDALDALRRCVPISGRVLLAGGGARSAAVRQVLADLCDLPVVVVDAEEAAAAGACVQAASVLTGTSAADIAAGWKLGVGHPVDRSAAATSAAEVRAAYASLRDLLHP